MLSHARQRVHQQGGLWSVSTKPHSSRRGRRRSHTMKHTTSDYLTLLAARACEESLERRKEAAKQWLELESKWKVRTASRAVAEVTGFVRRVRMIALTYAWFFLTGMEVVFHNTKQHNKACCRCLSHCACCWSMQRKSGAPKRCSKAHVSPAVHSCCKMAER